MNGCVFESKTVRDPFLQERRICIGELHTKKSSYTSITRYYDCLYYMDRADKV